MICQLCLAKTATNHVTERSPSGRLEQAHYCQACYEAKFLKPPPASDFPRPRFTLKNVMLLLGVWIIPNAIAAWVMRSGHVTGTPAQLRQWTIDTFLAVNLLLGFFVGYISLLTWLTRVMWSRRTGGLVPMPEPKLPPRQYAALIVRLIVRMMPDLAWLFIAFALEGWLTPKLWPTQRHSAPLFALIAWAPLLPFIALSLSKNEVVRQTWRTAAAPERILRSVTIAWSIGLVLVVVIGGPSLLGWGFVPWFPIPPILLIWIVGQLRLMTATALSIRRR